MISLHFDYVPACAGALDRFTYCKSGNDMTNEVKTDCAGHGFP